MSAEPAAAVLARVRAVLRVRPPLPDERGEEAVLAIDGCSATIPNPRLANQSLAYTFDGCYTEASSQVQIFTDNVLPLLEHVLHGYNSTVFAYGNTGTGKTFTMQGSPADPGMIERAVQQLLLRLEAKSASLQVRWRLSMSYLEIYREKVYDLMAASPVAADLPIREDQQRNILVPGLTAVPIRTMEEFRGAFAVGRKNRSSAATRLNSQSSRSHACLMLSLEQQPPLGPGLRSKLHLIDLAGSEDNRRTANTGERLVESGAINSSLFVLGQVVDALNRQAPRIPYRDSKLTRLLQDSLGGRAYALVITNVAPTVGWLPETCASLNFAAKSRNIQNCVTLNTVEEPKPAENDAQTKATKKRARKNARTDSEAEEEEDSVYALSEPPSSVGFRKTRRAQVLPTPPETSSSFRSTSCSNPFVDAVNPIESVIERQIEAKVAAKLREISKGTILRYNVVFCCALSRLGSPLLKGRHGELDLKQLRKTIKKGSSALHRAEGSENVEPNAHKPKSKKLLLEDETALKEMSGILNMFPTVEPDLLHVINDGSEPQLRKLKELGQSRADDVVRGRKAGIYKNLLELESRGVFGAKLLLKVVYANAMDADGLAALAHNVQPKV